MRLWSKRRNQRFLSSDVEVKNKARCNCINVRNPFFNPCQGQSSVADRGMSCLLYFSYDFQPRVCEKAEFYSSFPRWKEGWMPWRYFMLACYVQLVLDSFGILSLSSSNTLYLPGLDRVGNYGTVLIAAVTLVLPVGLLPPQSVEDKLAIHTASMSLFSWIYIRFEVFIVKPYCCIHRHWFREHLKEDQLHACNSRVT